MIKNTTTIPYNNYDQRNDVFILLALGLLDTFLMIDHNGSLLHNLSSRERHVLCDLKVLP